MRKNLMLFKDLGKKNVHYSVFLNGSMIDCHETLETEMDSKKKHSQLFEMQFDWQFLMERMAQEIKANWNSLFQIAKINDPEWQDLEIEFIPLQMLTELLSPIVKGYRWNIDMDFLKKLEQSSRYAKLGELADYGSVMGMSSEGYSVLSDGTDCLLFDTSKLSKIIEKNFELSIRKIHLRRYTLDSIFWCIKIRLLNFNRSAVSHFKKLKLSTQKMRETS
jgi:hypothetical protein